MARTDGTFSPVDGLIHHPRSAKMARFTLAHGTRTFMHSIQMVRRNGSSRPAAKSFPSPAIGGDGKIYFGSKDRKFYALDDRGSKQWEYETGGAIISSCALNGDHCLYFASVDGYFYALNFDGNCAGGSHRWYYRIITRYCRGWNDLCRSELRVMGYHWPMENKNGPVGLKAKLKPPHRRWRIRLSVSSPSMGVARFGFRKRRINWTYNCFGYGYASPAVSPSGEILSCRTKAPLFGSSRESAAGQIAWPKFRGNSRNTGNIGDRENKGKTPHFSFLISR